MRTGLGDHGSVHSASASARPHVLSLSGRLGRGLRSEQGLQSAVHIAYRTLDLTHVALEPVHLRFERVRLLLDLLDLSALRASFRASFCAALAALANFFAFLAACQLGRM